jgi:glycosyltransferase involved in cell wall biosynthesis
MWFRLLLKVPYKFTASGSRWIQFYKEMGVESHRILPVGYWLPKSFKIADHPKKVENRLIKFLFIGWMIKEKGIYEIIDAITILMNDYKFSFKFIGGGTLFDEVTEIIYKNNWSDYISAEGWVSSAYFEKIVDSSDVFVLPSYAEGFPMSLIEAMSKGMPSICSDVGGISDSLHNGSNGFLIPPKEVTPLLEAMKAYIVNPNLIEAHSIVTLSVVKANHNQYENCKKFFKTFD